MNTILLFIICILLIWDIVLLRKLYKSSINGNSTISDDKYFELKYNINLLKAISAILIFVVGYLGYSSYSNFKEELTSDLDETTKEQRRQIDSLNDNIATIKSSLEELDSLRGKLKENISDYDSKMKLLNSKVSSINNTLKYNPRIFVVNDIRYPMATINSSTIEDEVKVYFKDLTTSFNEKLPEFKKAPLVNVEGHRLDMHVLEVTNEYFRVAEWSYRLDHEMDKERGYFTFDIWIASFD